MSMMMMKIPYKKRENGREDHEQHVVVIPLLAVVKERSLASFCVDKVSEETETREQCVEFFLLFQTLVQLQLPIR